MKAGASTQISEYTNKCGRNNKVGHCEVDHFILGMRKNEFNKRTGGRHTGATPRNERYAHLSASSRRDGDDSGHSFHEIARMTAQSRRRHGAVGGVTSEASRDGSRPTPKPRRRKNKRWSWYAVADPHKPTWGVYSNWDEVKKLKAGRVRGFNTEHEAREWLEEVDYAEAIPTNVDGTQTHRFAYNARRGKGKRKKKAGPKTWYAVVRGYVPGVYANWEDAWVQTDGYLDSRPYKAPSRQEAVEIFMRWGGGHQRHPASSTMALRGEEIAEYAGKFLGREGAEIIRARARERHAQVRLRKFEETGDPIWDTGSSTARTMRSVEAAQSAATSKRPPNERRSSFNIHHPIATGASQEKVMNGTRGNVQSSRARRGMTSSASAVSSTTKPTPPVHAHEGGAHLSSESDSTAAFVSPMGARQRDRDSLGPTESVATGNAHKVRSPVISRGKGDQLPSSNSGAVDGGNVKYVDAGNSSHGDEPRLQNTAVPSETRGPLGDEPLYSGEPLNGGKRSTGGRLGKQGPKVPATDTSSGASHMHFNTPSSHDASDEPAGTSTESDRMRAKILFSSTESTQSTAPQEELASAKAALKTLEAWGFSAISKAEAEQQKHQDLAELNRQLERTSAQLTATKTKLPARRLRIPRKKRAALQHHEAGKGNGPIPVPIKMPDAKQTPAGCSRKLTSSTSRETCTARKPPLSKREMQDMIRKRERQLAKAVQRAKQHEAAEADMMDRILKSDAGPKQKYWRRLRKAEYFEDSSDEDEGLRRRVEISDDSSSDAPDREIWDGEPEPKTQNLTAEDDSAEEPPEPVSERQPTKAPLKTDSVDQLRARLLQHKKENSELKEKLNDVMSMLLDMRNELKQSRIRRNKGHKPEPEVKVEPAGSKPEVSDCKGPATSVHSEHEQSTKTFAEEDSDVPPSRATAVSVSSRISSASSRRTHTENTGQADNTDASDATTDSPPRHESTRSGPMSNDGSGEQPPVASVGPRVASASTHSTHTSEVTAQHDATTAASTGHTTPRAGSASSPDEAKQSETQSAVVDPTSAEPSAQPPVLPEGTLGLQQLLIGSKTLKENKMDTLYSANDEKIMAWRLKREEYIKGIREHNAGHAIKLSIRPVKDFVDEVIWNAVSRKKLKEEHKTARGKPANHVQCAAYFTGTGDYAGHIVTVSADVMTILKNVKYQKGRRGATHEDRWYSFISRRDKALKKIPEAQQNNVRFKEAHARYLRSLSLTPTLTARACNESIQQWYPPRDKRVHPLVDARRGGSSWGFAEHMCPI